MLLQAMLRTRARDCLLVCGCGLGLLAEELLVARAGVAGVGLGAAKGWRRLARAGFAVRIGDAGWLAIRNGRVRCLRCTAQSTSVGGGSPYLEISEGGVPVSLELSVPQPEDTAVGIAGIVCGRRRAPVISKVELDHPHLVLMRMHPLSFPVPNQHGFLLASPALLKLLTKALRGSGPFICAGRTLLLCWVSSFFALTLHLHGDARRFSNPFLRSIRPQMNREGD